MIIQKEKQLLQISTRYVESSSLKFLLEYPKLISLVLKNYL